MWSGSTTPCRQRTVPVVYTLLLLACCPFSQCYHDADNVEYDCWPLDADRDSTRTIDCGGLAMEWLLEPPDVVERGEQFNVRYRATAAQHFYTMQTVYFETRASFAAMNQTFGEPEVRELCNNTVCPSDISLANRTNCCIWHANVHTCHPSVLEERAVCGPSICGPWVGNDGLLATHTSALVGNFQSDFFAEGVQIDYEGLNFLIAHLRVGDIQIAIGKSVEVILPRVCGDDVCTAEIGEECSVCPRDCCPQMSSGVLPRGGIAAIVIIALLVLLAVIVFAAIAGICYHQRRKQFFDESWIISYEDIEQDTSYRGVLGSMVSLKKLRYLNAEAESSKEGHESSLTLGSMKKAQIFTLTGRYEGKIVAIKKVPKHDFVISKQVRREVHQIRKLDHPNLCRFIGATVKETANFCIISEYCPKGSLNDVLQNDDVPLNWGFRFSFAQDIARGMAYLHSRRLYHGRLTSSNCTIDDRWVVKIADYGVPTLRCVQERRKSCEAGLATRGGRSETALKIYMPPEVRQSFPSSPPTAATDVYSFAVVLVEIGTHIDTFSEDVVLDSNHRPRLRLADLSDGSTTDPCPCPQEYMELVQQCWMFLPHSRPSFEQIKKTIYRINPSRQSPVDNMMFMMEKYSKNLEQLVAERTQELIAEQNKTAQLLHRMLPKSVADDLKQGKPAPAAGFKCATIYFSDIIGFTSLASSSTPLQIVKLLNELYSIFDDIIDHYDVYKVETIGDAYMVVSGVPVENGDRHAGEIASMALQFMQACQRFRIPHRSTTAASSRLEIRAGMHSGPVCAGVVGVKMPRYCLFGDTVNTASRMETTSEAMKIQCSDASYQLLKKQGWFHLDCRGTISVKGKGEMTTWWLVGQDSDAEQQRNRTVLEQPASSSPRKQMPAIMQLRDGSQQNGKKYSMESGSSSNGHSTSLPGSVVVEELV